MTILRDLIKANKSLSGARSKKFVGAKVEDVDSYINTKDYQKALKIVRMACRNIDKVEQENKAYISEIRGRLNESLEMLQMFLNGEGSKDLHTKLFYAMSEIFQHIKGLRSLTSDSSRAYSEYLWYPISDARDLIGKIGK